jgi:hypothetical protein
MVYRTEQGVGGSRNSGIALLYDGPVRKHQNGGKGSFLTVSDAQIAVCRLNVVVCAFFFVNWERISYFNLSKQPIMKLLKWPALLLAFASGYAQSLLNGDFENNSASQCEFNLPNTDYASKMDHSWAFGNGEEVDIQTFVCGYESPQAGSWFVSLSKDTEGNCDAISLEISEKLSPGQAYTVSFFNCALMGSTPLQFGLSTSASDFGDLLYASTPVLNLWEQKTFTFTAPNNGQYLTVRTDSASPQGGWNLLDNVQLSGSLAVDDYQRAEVAVFPNPSTGEFSVSANSGIAEVRIFNALGQLVRSQSADGVQTASFWLDADGVYFVNLSISGTWVSKKLVVSRG